MSTGNCTTYQPNRGKDQAKVTKKVNNGTIKYFIPHYTSGSSSNSEYSPKDADTYLLSKYIDYDGHMSTTNAHSAFLAATCTRIHRDEAVKQCNSLKPSTLDCEKSFNNDNVFMCAGVVSIDENQQVGASKYRRLATINPTDDSPHSVLGYIESLQGDKIVHESFTTFDRSSDQ